MLLGEGTQGRLSGWVRVSERALCVVDQLSWFFSITCVVEHGQGQLT